MGACNRQEEGAPTSRVHRTSEGRAERALYGPVTRDVLLMKMKKRILLTCITAFLLLYVGSYALLSSQGQYVPGAWGLGWVKWYIWAPHGFVSGPMGTEHNRTLQGMFLPLWWIDMQCIHTSDQLPDERYPINTKLDDELRKGLKEMEQKTIKSRILALTRQILICNVRMKRMMEE